MHVEKFKSNWCDKKSACKRRHNTNVIFRPNGLSQTIQTKKKKNLKKGYLVQPEVMTYVYNFSVLPRNNVLRGSILI